MSFIALGLGWGLLQGVLTGWLGIGSLVHHGGLAQRFGQVLPVPHIGLQQYLCGVVAHHADPRRVAASGHRLCRLESGPALTSPVVAPAKASSHTCSSTSRPLRCSPCTGVFRRRVPRCAPAQERPPTHLRWRSPSPGRQTTGLWGRTTTECAGALRSWADGVGCGGSQNRIDFAKGRPEGLRYRGARGLRLIHPE